MESKKRRTNYTAEEKKLLSELYETFKHIVGNKKTDAITNQQKDATWQGICNIFNSKSLNVHRDAASLRKMLSNMKQDEKKKVAKEKEQIQTIKIESDPSGHREQNSCTELEIECTNIVPGHQNNENIEDTASQSENEDTEVQMEGVILEIDENLESNRPTPLPEEKQKTTITNRWTNVNKISPLDRAKIKVLQLQAEQIKKQIEREERQEAIKIRNEDILFRLQQRHKEEQIKKLELENKERELNIQLKVEELNRVQEEYKKLL